MIEIEAELGLPSVILGVIDIEQFKPYFSEEQLGFLSLHANASGWGCLWTGS